MLSPMEWFALGWKALWIVVLLLASWASVALADRLLLPGCSFEQELKRGNLAVGVMLAGFFLGFFIALGLVLG